MLQIYQVLCNFDIVLIFNDIFMSLSHHVLCKFDIVLIFGDIFMSLSHHVIFGDILMSLSHHVLCNFDIVPNVLLIDAFVFYHTSNDCNQIYIFYDVPYLMNYTYLAHNEQSIYTNFIITTEYYCI